MHRVSYYPSRPHPTARRNVPHSSTGYHEGAPSASTPSMEAPMNKKNNWKEVWWRLLQHGVVGAGGHGWPMKRGTACPCGWQHSAASPRATQALQLREHVFWTCTEASAIIRAIQHNLPVSVQLLPRHVWLLEQPCQTVRKELWYFLCLAALTAILRARGNS